jgi:hypothetical protein
MSARPTTRRPATAGSSLAAALALAFLLSAPSASGGSGEEAEVRLLRPSPALLGTWTTQGSGIAKVVIGRSQPGWVRLVAYGRCHPTLCNWGPIRARLYADGAFSGVGTGLIASYDLDFVLTTVTAHLSGGTLRVETYERFVDGSGRSDYWRSVDMRRR